MVGLIKEANCCSFNGKVFGGNCLVNLATHNIMYYVRKLLTIKNFTNLCQKSLDAFSLVNHIRMYNLPNLSNFSCQTFLLYA